MEPVLLRLALLCILTLLIGASPARSNLPSADPMISAMAESSAIPVPGMRLAQATPGDYGQLGQARTPGRNAAQDEPTFEDYARVAEELSMLSETQVNLSKVRDRLIDLVKKAPRVPGEIIELLRDRSPTGEPKYLLATIFWTLVFLVIGFLFSRFVYGRHVVGPWFVALQRPDPQGIVGKLPILAIRAALGVGGVLIALGIGGLLSYSFLDPSDEVTSKTVLVTLGTVGIGAALMSIWRMVLSPFLPDYRIPCMEDVEAKRLFRWLSATVTFSFALLAICYWLQEIGLRASDHQFLLISGSLVTVIAIIMMIGANRSAISMALLGGCDGNEATWVQRGFSVLWAPMAILYFIGAWVVQTYRTLIEADVGAPLIVGALIILLAVLVAYGVVAYVIALLFQRGRALARSQATSRENEMAEEEAARLVSSSRLEGDPLSGDGDEESGPSGTSPVALGEAQITPKLRSMRDFEDLARRTASIVAAGAGLYALIRIWGYGFLLEDGGWLDRLEGVIDITLVGYVIYHALRIWIDTRIEEEGGYELNLEPGDEGVGSSASRLATLLPLFRNFLLFTIFTTIILMVLLEVGINVAPLFAGAGVVGLAIGFGAQTLIRDILSGAFYLFDDAFRKGEYIDIGTVKGTVEKISVRSFQLRHHLGALHTVPFGEITHLTNYSRDWVMMKLPLRVTYDTDVEKVRKLVKKLGQELLDHPLEGPKFLQPLKSQGVYRMEDSAMIIRIKFMTRPGDQWTTRKLVYSRIRELFEANGVKFAHREVTVRLKDREAGELSPDEQQAVAAAAHRATVAADEAMGPMPQTAMGDR